MRPTFLVPAVLAAALAGCATHPTSPEPVTTAPETPVQAQERRQQASKPTYNLAGYPPAVREGYIDGCETAKATKYGRKDAARFSGDPQYQMGWKDGFGICGGPATPSAAAPRTR